MPRATAPTSPPSRSSRRTPDGHGPRRRGPLHARRRGLFALVVAAEDGARGVALEPQEVVAGPAAHHQARRLATLAPNDALHGSVCAHPLAGPRLVGKAAAEGHHLAQIGHAGPLEEPQLAERVAAGREQGVAVVDDPRLHELSLIHISEPTR